MRLIFCLGANRRFSSLARRAGWWPGARLPATLYPAHFPLAFADQNWSAYQRALERSPGAAHSRRTAYMRALKAARPAMASVLDWERAEQLEEVLSWATEAAEYVQTVMLIPKVVGGVKCLPEQINGHRVVLGYSIPTTHGGTRCGLREFHGRRVHLLGGSPRQQLQAAQLLRGKAEVVSADGNICHRAAGRGTYWTGQHWRNDGAYATTTEEALWRSLLAIGRMWQRAGWELERAPRLADHLFALESDR
jgi:hypothetical protein